MKKYFLSGIILFGLTFPAFAWYDGYGVYHCTYLDPLTSLLDSVFGQPCPPSVMVVERTVAVPVPQPYPVPEPYPVEVPVAVPVYQTPPPQLKPCPTYGYWCW